MNEAARRLGGHEDARGIPRRETLDELLRLDPDNLQAKLRLALVLNRLGDGHEAELMLREISAQAPKDMDVLNTLGRVYKDLWRRQWEDIPDMEQRRSAALRGYALASRAANYFSDAFFGNLNAHQSGINALGMIALCDLLGRTGGEELTVVRQAYAGIAEAVQLAAHAVLSRGNVGGMRPVDEVWASAACLCSWCCSPSHSCCSGSASASDQRVAHIQRADVG
jgi:tetratricopeptide (TPR) repeat protein